MPYCYVKACKNQSQCVNYKKHGVTYHLFPSDPIIKEKWIDACGRGPDWFPTNHGTVCSSHFKENCFQPEIKSRRLFEWALPSLKLRLTFAPVHTNESREESEPGRSMQQQHNLSSTQQSVITKANMEHTQINLKFRVQLNQHKRIIYKQKQKIHQLQKKVFQYKRKVAGLKNSKHEFDYV